MWQPDPDYPLSPCAETVAAHRRLAGFGKARFSGPDQPAIRIFLVEFAWAPGYLSDPLLSRTGVCDNNH